MDYIQKLPLVLSISMAIIIGIISFGQGIIIQDIYIRMIISMLAFFIIGVYIRSTISNINEEIIRKKNEEEKQAELERKAKEREMLQNAANGNSPQIDLRVDDFGEDFTPLKVSDIIKTKINE